VSIDNDTDGETTRITRKGQVTIPKELREEYGLIRSCVPNFGSVGEDRRFGPRRQSSVSWEYKELRTTVSVVAGAGGLFAIGVCVGNLLAVGVGGHDAVPARALQVDVG